MDTLKLLSAADPTASLEAPAAVQLPEPWHSVFSSPREQWPRLALDLWATHAASLPQFLAAQRANLRDVLLVRFDGLLQVAYQYADECVFLGGLPLGRDASLGLLETAPPALKRIYRELHDGYVFPFARSLGPLPRRHVFTLADDEWGWLEDSDDPAVFSPLDEKVVVMANGGGGYLCFDASEPRADDTAGIVWWKDGPPDRAGFLPVLDAWMEVGLTS